MSRRCILAVGVFAGVMRCRNRAKAARAGACRGGPARGALSTLGRWAVLGAAVLLLPTACGRAAAGTPRSAVDPSLTNQANLARYTSAELHSVDPGAPMHGVPAPGFTLTDQFGKPVSLSQFRGKVVVLSFDDDECTTICPLTTATLVEALDLLGPAAAHVQLLGVNANPDHTSVQDVAAFSRQHGMTARWLFLTGTKAHLGRIWKAYGIYDQVVQGTVDHTPAVYLIGAKGHEQRLFLTSSEYGVVPLEAHGLARAIARLLPGHPSVAAAGSPAGGAIDSPAEAASLPSLEPGGKAVVLDGSQPRLVVFFASWAPGASQQLLALNRYSAAAGRAHLPAAVAVDVEPVEPSLAAVRDLPAIRAGTLRVPLAVDTSGRVADAYGVQDIPWMALVDHGKVVWSHDGWLATGALETAVTKALAAGGAGQA